jgi:tripartite ATP-independent transporter DctM subunit
VLILLGDQLSNSYQAAQLARGNFAPQSVTVADLFAGAICPAFVLVFFYALYVIAVAAIWPKKSPAIAPDPNAPHGAALGARLATALVAPFALILAVLGSILAGIATPTEAASVGAVGAMLLAAPRAGAKGLLMPVMIRTTQITSMIFVILIGATVFSLVFRGLGGDGLIERVLNNLPGGVPAAILAVMIAVFLLGFVMDAFEIIFVVVPIVAPVLLQMPGVDPVWLGIMFAVNLQTSYMHPPLGPTLFYLRGVAPPEVTTRHIYLGIIPFVLIQLAMLLALWFAPPLATWLPHRLYAS